MAYYHETTLETVSPANFFFFFFGGGGECYSILYPLSIYIPINKIYNWRIPDI